MYFSLNQLDILLTHTQGTSPVELDNTVRFCADLALLRRSLTNQSNVLLDRQNERNFAPGTSIYLLVPNYTPVIRRFYSIDLAVFCATNLQ